MVGDGKALRGLESEESFSFGGGRVTRKKNRRAKIPVARTALEMTKESKKESGTFLLKSGAFIRFVHRFLFPHTYTTAVDVPASRSLVCCHHSTAPLGRVEFEVYFSLKFLQTTRKERLNQAQRKEKVMINYYESNQLCTVCARSVLSLICADKKKAQKER